MSNWLKPCPFCGGTNLEKSYADTIMREDFRRGIYCCDCGDSIAPYNETLKEAVANWNTRAERTCRNLHESPLDFECSECHFAVTTDPAGLPNWQTEFWQRCPRCGARVVSE